MRSILRRLLISAVATLGFGLPIAALTGALSLMVANPEPAQAAGAGNIIKITIPYSSFSVGAATTATATVHHIKNPRVVIGRSWIQVDQVFAGIVDAGPSVTAATISVGRSGSVARNQAAANVFTGASTGWANAVVGIPVDLPEVTDTDIIATLTTTSANTNVLTQGIVTIYLEIAAVP